MKVLQANAINSGHFSALEEAQIKNYLRNMLMETFIRISRLI